MSLTGLFAEAMAANPERVAVATSKEDLTYAELAGRAAVIARALNDHGVRHDDLVGIFMERSVDTVSALLGVWFSGGAYVPLDPEYPSDRIAYMVEDSGLGLVLTSRTLAADIARPGLTVMAIEDILEGAGAAESSALHEFDPDSSALAYVIYTSGSTGRPKGVEVLRGSVHNFLQSMAVTPGIGAGDVLVAVTTLSFDIAALELFLPLTVGATTYVADTETSTDGASLATTLEHAGATVMQATPSTWRILLESGWTAPAGFRVLCGGEALPPDLAKALTAVAPEVWNMYGPTETTIWSTCYRLPEGGTPVLVGRPIDRTTVYVLDKAMRLVPPGVQGEIWIGGAGLARGYRNQPERTAEAFVPDPFSKAPGERLYRTGDLGRYLNDGNLECRGRADTQVKVRGFRIELGEIESALTRHPAVREAAVIVDRSRADGPRIIAYTVAEAEVGPSPSVGSSPEPSALRTHLREWVPAHMIPNFFVSLDEMPLTANRKIDRKRLPPVDAAQTDAGVAAFVAPRSATETAVVAAWQDVLALPRVSADADFFVLGGHSVLAIRVVARLKRDLDVKLTLRHFFEAPRVDRMAERIDELRAEAGGTSSDEPREVMVF